MELMQITDTHILNIREGNRTSFKLLYEAVFPPLILFSRRFVDEKDAAADLVQEALLAYWNRRKEFKTVIEVKAFLYGTLKNMCLNHLRTKKVHGRYVQKTMKEAERTSEAVDEPLVINNAIIEEETFALLYRALSELPPREKEIMELSLQGKKNQAIADILSLSVNTIKTLKLRAYRRLRESIR
jgi:RNA polymerase sigma-70 factor (ECF subfamily)